MAAATLAARPGAKVVEDHQRPVFWTVIARGEMSEEPERGLEMCVSALAHS